MYGISEVRPATVGEPLVDANLNPPHFHFLVLPLTVAGPAVAVAIWTAGSVGAGVLALRLISRELAVPFALPFLAALLWSPTGATLATGQVALFLAVPATAAWRALRQDRPLQAGAWLGLVASMKPFLGIFALGWLVQRQWRALAGFALAAAAAVGVGMSVFGLDAYRGWLGSLADVTWTAGSLNASVHRLGRGMVATQVVAVAILTLTLVAPARDADRRVAQFLLAALLVSPLGWVYYLWLGAGPLLVSWLALWRQRDQTVPILLAVCLSLNAVLLEVAQTPALMRLTIGSAQLWGVLGWWGLLTWPEVRRLIRR